MPAVPPVAAPTAHTSLGPVLAIEYGLKPAIANVVHAAPFRRYSAASQPTHMFDSDVPPSAAPVGHAAGSASRVHSRPSKCMMIDSLVPGTRAYTELFAVANNRSIVPGCASGMNTDVGGCPSDGDDKFNVNRGPP